MTFSVIIPVYNVAPYLKACLDSVVTAAKRAQASVEIVCVDDGSTDGSGVLLDTYVAYPLRVVHQPNAGVAAARNRGLEIATGDWFLFLDADDILRETVFADLIAARNQHADDDLFAYGLWIMETNAAHPAWHAAQDGRVDRYDLRETLPDSCAMLSACRFAFCRSRYGDIRFPLYAHGEDLVFVAHVLARATALVYLVREEYGYRDRPGSAVHAAPSVGGVHEAIAFHSEMFQVLAAAGKRLGRGNWQMRLEQWILRLPIVMAGHGRDAAWCGVWREWRQSMATARRLPCVTGVCRRIAVLAVCCPFRPVVECACWLSLRWVRWRQKR